MNTTNAKLKIDGQEVEKSNHHSSFFKNDKDLIHNWLSNPSEKEKENLEKNIELMVLNPDNGPYNHTHKVISKDEQKEIENTDEWKEYNKENKRLEDFDKKDDENANNNIAPKNKTFYWGIDNMDDLFGNKEEKSPTKEPLEVPQEEEKETSLKDLSGPTEEDLNDPENNPEFYLDDDENQYKKISNVEVKSKNEPQTEFYTKGTTPINKGSSYITPYKFVFKKGSIHHSHISKNQFGKEGKDGDVEQELGEHINNFLKETHGTKTNKNFNLNNLKMVMNDKTGDITAKGILEHSK